MELKYITVSVIRYDGKIAFYNTYLAKNYADAIRQMEKEYKIDKGIITRIECK